ncbi:hypothetical protein BDB00DRAFT_953048 [Zychaea mexicana]|uniref:uncharacterized protein n=1 Tax=Zychaea mexicana TaxID=64656 RepID=UPI0022FED0E2|nr:uncharacterized protein BDB00DRAFT_953048 [Zychaea mexicana]KAI9496536.1 hypothetical protein BDB00DRAFT_953048 [Zychaea mexicana]
MHYTLPSVTTKTAVVALLTVSAVTVAVTAQEQEQSQTSPYLAVSSPVWLADFKGPLDNARSSLTLDEDSIKVRPLDKVSNLNLGNYPPPMKAPPVDDPEVQAVIKQLDWSKVPDAPVRRAKNGDLNFTTYDTESDPHCWWSSTLCKKPKLDYIPEDVSYCPHAGDWGLNYDDGPYRVWSEDEDEKKYEEPRLYNFLIEQDKQKATLFFIGSNVMTFPEAAQRAFSDGHTICSHTWSHPLMTTLSNEQIVSELYFTQKAIKEVVGITPKCWRPPFGDIDDRVRAIAWLMGMRAILWDRDSNDWALAAQSISAATVNGYFNEWVELRVADKDNEHGHIPLQHESSNETIMLTEKWLPELKKHFNVVPIHQCIGDESPYWEDLSENQSAAAADKHVAQAEKHDDSSQQQQEKQDNSNSLPHNKIAIGSNKTLSKDHHQKLPTSAAPSFHAIDFTLLLSTIILFVVFA